jgi:hypothetical protein
MTSKAHGIRLFAAAVAAAGLALAGVAQASPSHPAGKKKVKPVCNLIKASANTAVPPSLQITSADIASNAQTVTMAIRVTKLTPQPDAAAPLGREWNLSFVAGPTVQLEVVDGPFGVTTNLPGKATLDTAHNEVRLSVSAKDIVHAWPTAQLTPGRSLFTGITALATTMVQTPAPDATHQQGQSAGFNWDQAVSPRNYLAGTPSCLKVGS